MKNTVDNDEHREDEPYQAADCAFSVSGRVIAPSKTVLNTARGQNVAERKTAKL